MILSQLQLHQFRNIESANITLSPGFNVFYGDNGSGKTSLLEAIYYLAMAKSFRSHYSRFVIRDGQEALAVFASGGEDNQETLGISKTKGGECILKANGEVVASQGFWVKQLPVLLINHDTYQLLDAGPKIRRQFIDWGAFHVKPQFFEAWQGLQKILRQRNAALRAELPDPDILVWDQQLLDVCEEMTNLRKSYLEDFFKVFQEILDQFIALGELKVTFYPGWPEKQDYLTVLHESLYRDRQYGYTRLGPHRADLKFTIDGKPADEVLSRGQQKVFVAALKLAQGEVLKQFGKKCLYLVDDLPSELDVDKQARVIRILKDIAPQVFVTGITLEALAPLFQQTEAEVFHVKHGEIQLN